MDDVIHFYKESILPAMKGQTGFKSAILLCNHDTRQFIVLSLWESLANLLTAEASAYLQAQFRQLRPLLTTLLANEHYAVSVQD